MNRTDLQRLSNIRLREAQALFAATEFSGAYYLAGYTLECALKACIARRTQLHDFPDKGLALASYTHSFEKLLQPAGLELECNSERKSSARFNASWRVVTEWNETSRYEEYSREQARDLLSALTEEGSGVLLWTRRFW